jgi:alanyl-tRNA synthetase
MNPRIYYTDPACREFDARVVASLEHEGRPAVRLDRSAFYPTSGGQPHDVGRLGGAGVVDVVDADAGVLHVLDARLPEDASVRGTIDWARRFDHMQQHTGQHILSAAFDRLFDNRTVSFHMGPEAVSIDLAGESSPEAIERALALANEVVWEDRPVTIRFATAAEAAALPLRKAPARDGDLRLIDVSGFDLSACGGTHVASTGQVGIIVALGAERFKGGTRLAFACGGRARRAFGSLRDAVAGCVRALSVLPAELPDAVARTVADAKDLRKANQRLQAALAAHEGARLAQDAVEQDGVRVVAAVLDGWDAAGLKAVALAAAASPATVVVLVSSTLPVSVVVARAPGLPADAGQVLRALIERFGGRGGGKADLAQGGGMAGDPAAILAAARAGLTGPGR